MAQCLAEFQHGHDLPPNGILTAATRLCLINAYPALGIVLIGPHLDRRILLDESQTEAAIHERCCEIIDALGGIVSTTPYVPQLLAIRGMARTSGHLWQQTDSAARFAAQTYGERDHFCARKTHFCDALMILFWREPQKRACAFEGVVSPNHIWPQGTAHLCDGQYFFRIGRHRTHAEPHIQAVLEASSQWPSDWVCDRQPDSIQYIALEGNAPIEVIRSRAQSLDLDENDIAQANLAIAHRQPNFTHHLSIKINIHTCPQHEAASLGCQNILPSDYAHVMATLLRLRSLQANACGFETDLIYSLFDASFIPS